MLVAYLTILNSVLVTMLDASISLLRKAAQQAVSATGGILLPSLEDHDIFLTVGIVLPAGRLAGGRKGGGSVSLAS